MTVQARTYSMFIVADLPVKQTAAADRTSLCDHNDTQDRTGGTESPL